MLLKRLFIIFVFFAAQVHAARVTQDTMIDAADPGIKLFVRSKMAQGQTRFNDDNVVLFVHGATYPSTPDFDLPY